MHQTGLFSLAAVVPESKSTELCSSAAVVPKSKPSCVARRPLCHEVNLPGYEARRRDMTCYIFGTGQTYTPAHSSATQVTEINTLDQITGKVIDVSRTHIPLKALMIPLKP